MIRIQLQSLLFKIVIDQQKPTHSNLKIQHCTRNFEREAGNINFVNSKINNVEESDFLQQWKDDFSLFNSLELVKDGGPRFSTPIISPGSDDYNRRSLPLMIYLPGFDGTGFSAYRQFPNLLQKFDLKCMTIPPHDRSTFQDLISIVKDYLVFEALDSPINRPIYLLGESFGGLLAMAVAVECRDIVDRLIVVNPTTKFSENQWNSLRVFLGFMPDSVAPYLPIAMMPFLANPSSLPITFDVLNPFAVMNSVSMFQDFLRQVVTASSISEVLPIDTVLWKLQCLRDGCDYFELQGYQNIQQRTLIITSQQDIPSKEQGQRLQSLLPRATNICIANKGHMVLEAVDIDLFKILKDNGFYISKRKMTSFPENRSRQGNCFGQTGPVEILSTQNLQKEQMYQIFEFFSCLVSPVFFSTNIQGNVIEGLGNIPDGKQIMFVGNRQITGMEAGFIAKRFLEEKGTLPRGLTHPVLFEKNNSVMKLLQPVFIQYGAVPMTPSNMNQLLKIGESILVFPGGIQEVLNKQQDQYNLMCPEFVEMAAEFGVTIIPFSCVGANDSVEQVIATEQLFNIPIVGQMLKDQIFKAQGTAATTGRKGIQDEMTSTIASSITRQRLYMKFGSPIQVDKKWVKDKQRCRAVYQQIQTEVNEGLRYLLQKRDSDPYKHLVSRLLYEGTRGFQCQAPTFKP